MVNRSRTAAGACNPLSRSVRGAPSISAPALPRRSVAGCPVDVCASIGPRSGGAHVARRPGGDQRPAPRSVSNRRHGAPAPPSPSMRAARRSRAAWLRCRAPPVDRQHPVAPSNPAPASTPPVDARLGPVRPASARRPASEPPSTRPHTPNRPSARFCGPLSPAQTRSVGAQPPVGRPSALGQVRFGPQPGPGRSMSLPLRPAGSRSSCPQPPAPTRQGPPAPPTPAPRSVPGGGRDARAHICPRVRRGNFQKKSERGTIWRPGRGGWIHKWTGASVYGAPLGGGRKVTGFEGLGGGLAPYISASVG